MAFSSENGQALTDRQRLEGAGLRRERTPLTAGRVGTGVERLDGGARFHCSRRSPSRMPGTHALTPLVALLGRQCQVGQRAGIAVRVHGLVQRLVPPLATTALQ